MILLSLALVVASAGTLVGGLTTSSSPLVWTSLAAGLAAVALVAGSVARRRTRLPAGLAGAAPGAPSAPAAAAPVSPPAPTAPPVPPAPSVSGWSAPPAVPVPPGSVPSSPPRTGNEPSGGSSAASGPHPAQSTRGRQAQLSEPFAGPVGEPFPEPAVRTPDPLGEPAVESLPVRDSLRVAQLADEVVVRDGRPRYHLAGCPTLAGAAGTSALPVSVARRSGFTPCATCEPDRTLLARSRGRARPPEVSGGGEPGPPPPG